MIFDWTYLLIIVGVLITAYAQFKVQSTFKKYSHAMSRRGVPAHMVARQVLDTNGLSDVKIERVAGNLSDHYDPRSKTVRLSESVYNSPSIASIGVAVHEIGHAIQDQEDYGPLKLRSLMVPVAQFGSTFSWILIIAGIIFSSFGLVQVGIWAFAAVVLFQLVTLPVEFNASSRALVALEGGGYLERDEVPQAKKVLSSAAFTYIAAALVGILQLLRLVLIFTRRN